ncbi:hypothetical protein [Sphingomonas jatrophae]|uniref:Uncharacterized protein n=1 Tax=Sphingomonas jatrophae TaxID=1166337 RepID=A0A1I6LA80_9SPHN|nr:hypothetical protein [Sphingomonas jatrophae]SFS00349.1 hypothetical protein SAMN05192580_2499 [Sphingomonas jatrophae]
MDLPTDRLPTLRLDDLPDLDTRVGLAGTLHQAEVGGSVCFNSVITVVVVTEG